jgi:phosphatidylcholine synthase
MSSLRIKAFLVHVYTASTVILLLLSADLLLRDQLGPALLLMLLCMAIDWTDGMLARRYRVKEVVPEIDGRRLDDIVDYISYVFLPVVFMLKAGLLLEPAVLFGALPLLASAFGFARVNAKLDADGFFVGFPSYWNIAAAYFYLLDLPPALNTLLVVVFSVMVFIPTRYLYFTRFPHYKRLHYAGTLLYGLALLGAVFAIDVLLRHWLLYVSLVLPVYYMVYSFVLDWRARKATG